MAHRDLWGPIFCFSVEAEYSEDGACCLFDPRYDLFVFCQPGLWPKPLELFDIWICQKDNDACIGNEHLLYCTSLLFSYDLLSWKAFVSFGIEAERIWHGSQELEIPLFSHTLFTIMTDWTGGLFVFFQWRKKERQETNVNRA